MSDAPTLRSLVEADIRDWFTLPPSYRTKAKLIEMVGVTLGNATIICGCCGKYWDGEPCGQKDNGWPFPTCYPSEQR